MKTYIVIHPETLEVDVVTEPSPGWIVEPTEILPYLEGSPMARLAQDFVGERQPGSVLTPEGQRIWFSLEPPDPWLIAFLHVLWLGVVQGMAWDTVKFIWMKALRRLQSFDLAPSGSRTSTNFEISWKWKVVATDEASQKELFVRFQRNYEKLPPQERDKKPRDFLDFLLQ